MYSVRHALSFMQGIVKRYGPSNVKRVLWDKEFSGGKWDFIDNTIGDCVYPPLEKYAKGGSVLDLGCGPGNTANELADTAYQTYIGVDISEAALGKARRRTEENGRASKNSFAQGDFLSYAPPQKFDVILFRESLYHVPLGQVKTILDKYSKYLTDGGVFIVRLGISQTAATGRTQAMLGVIDSGFDVVEKCQNGEFGPRVYIFRPRSSEASGVSSLKSN